jgi:hypothetical protein
MEKERGRRERAGIWDLICLVYRHKNKGIFSRVHEERKRTESDFLDFGFVCFFQGSMPGEIPKDIRNGDGKRERKKEIKMIHCTIDAKKIL